VAITAPTDIADCVVWLDAADTGSITDAGSGAVSNWANKGSGSDVAQGTGGNRPTTGTRTLNSKNVIDFGGDDYLDGSITFAVNTGTFFSVYATDSAASAAQYGRAFCFFASATEGGDWNSTAGCIWAIADQDGQDFDTTYNGSGRFSGATLDTSAHIFTSRRNGATWTGRLDQADITGSSSVTTNFGPSTMRCGRGSNLSNSAEQFNGYVAEFVLYSTSLSDADRDDVEDYLFAKWFTAATRPPRTPPRLWVPTVRSRW
jgi:hypothetical protein